MMLLNEIPMENTQIRPYRNCAETRCVNMVVLSTGGWMTLIATRQTGMELEDRPEVFSNKMHSNMT